MRNNQTLLKRILNSAKKLYVVNLFGGSCKCGESRIQCLTFHHTDPKQKEKPIHKLIAGKLSKLLKELEKCELLCFNCHAKIHATNTTGKKVINKRFCLQYKNIDSCEICGDELDANISQFHHVRDKEFRLSKYMKHFTITNSDDIPDYFKKELDKCMCLCPNCHNDLHCDKEFDEKYVDEIIEKSKNIKEFLVIDYNEVYTFSLTQPNRTIIAEHFNVSIHRINRILAKYSKKTIRTINYELILQLHSSGLCNNEISRLANCFPCSVSNTLKRHGLVRNGK